MKLREAVGVSVVLHGVLILSTVLSINFSSDASELKVAGGDSYSVDYITITSGGEQNSVVETRESLKTLTTPNNKSNLAKLKYFDKSKKAKKKKSIVRNQTKKKKKTDKIAKFKRKFSSGNNNINILKQNGVRIGLNSNGSGFGFGNNGVSDPVFSGYFFRFKNKISRYWHKIPNPNKKEKKITIIKFKIFRNGSIDNVEIEKSSGNSFNDRAALRAIRSASPFERLPYQYRLNYLLIHFEFIWE